MIPCKLGMSCPYCCYGEDESRCTYPFIPNAATKEEFESAVREEYLCPLIDERSDMAVLMSMCNEYEDESQWHELMRRLSVHLDRTTGFFHERLKERVATKAWKQCIESLGAEE